jgi:hypothetical protein
MKYWTEGNQIILITADNLLFGDYRQTEIKELTDQLVKGVMPNHLTGIPLRYIKDIQLDDRKRRIDVELGKGSIEQIEFKSKQLRNTVFEYIKDNFKVFSLTRPSSSRIWKRYCITMLFIAFIIFLLLTAMQFSGYSPGAKAIGILLTWLSETLSKTTITIIGLALMIWRTIILLLDLKALTKTLRLSRKDSN